MGGVRLALLALRRWMTPRSAARPSLTSTSSRVPTKQRFNLVGAGLRGFKGTPSS